MSNLTIRKRRLRITRIENVIYIIFAVIPFTLLINTMIFNNARIMGIGITNFFVDIIILLVFIDSLLRPKVYRNRSIVYLFMLLFALLHVFKFLSSSDALSNFSAWFIDNQYYYFLPLIVLMVSNKNLNYSVIAKRIIWGSWIICPLSMLMFLTSEYYGMVSQQNMLVYDIVGTPFARMFSIFGSPNVAGTYFCIVILFCYYYNRYRPGWSKVLLLLNLLCLVLTFSKGSMIGLLFVLIYQYLFVGNMKDINKYFKMFILIIAFVFGVIFVSDQGYYFWQSSEIFKNVRLVKWAAGLKAIANNWILGSDFTQHIYSINTWESTLSDNSFLLFIGHFGIPFFVLTIILIVLGFTRRKENVKQSIIPGIITIVVLCSVYDFIQMYPTNYMTVAFFAFVQRNETTNNTKMKRKRL